MLTTLSFDVLGYLRSIVIESCSVLRLSYHPVAFFDPPTHWDRTSVLYVLRVTLSYVCAIPDFSSVTERKAISQLWH